MTLAMLHRMPSRVASTALTVGTLVVCGPGRDESYEAWKAVAAVGAGIAIGTMLVKPPAAAPVGALITTLPAS